MTKVEFKIHADGASFNNGYKNKSKPMLCSYGYVISLNYKPIATGTEAIMDKDSSFAEVMGALAALRKLDAKIKALSKPLSKPYKVTVTSDNQFVTKGVNEWIDGWISRGWKNNAGKEVAHVELWKELYNDYLMNDDYDIEFRWVRGHTGGKTFDKKMNDICDRLAVETLAKKREDEGIV